MKKPLGRYRSKDFEDRRSEMPQVKKILPEDAKSIREYVRRTNVQERAAKFFEREGDRQILNEAATKTISPSFKNRGRVKMDEKIRENYGPRTRGRVLSELDPADPEKAKRNARRRGTR